MKKFTETQLHAMTKKDLVALVLKHQRPVVSPTRAIKTARGGISSFLKKAGTVVEPK